MALAADIVKGIIDELPRILQNPEIKARVAPVMKALVAEGVEPEVAMQVRGQAFKEATKIISEGMNVTPKEAGERVFTEYMEDMGHLPQLSGEIKMTYPMLPAEINLGGIPKSASEPVRQLERLPKGFNPAYKAEVVFGPSGSPALDLVDAMGHLHSNTANLTRHVRDYLRVNKVAEEPEFVEDFLNGFTATRELSNTAESIGSQIERAEVALSKTKGIRQRVKIENTLKPLYEQLETVRDKILEVNDPIMRKWADRSASVRIMAALESETYPWAKEMLNPKEQQAVKAIRETFDAIKQEADRQGIPMLSREYAPHYTGRLRKLLEDKFSPDYVSRTRIFNLPNNLAWKHRTRASVQWWPVVHQLPRYYADASRRLAMNPAIQKWEPVFRKLETMGKQPEANYFRDWMKNVQEGDWFTGMASRMIEGIVGFEYLTKIGLSVPVAIKHAAKMLKALGTHPVYFTKGMGSSFGELGKSFLRRLDVDLQKYGIESTGTQRLAKMMLQNRALVRGYTGIDLTADYSKYLLNSVTAFPTTAVEAFERFSLMNGLLLKGISHSATPEKMLQQMYHSLMDISFIGQVDRYSWLRKPLQRLFFMFYYTPMRVTEQTAKNLLFSVWREKEMQLVKQEAVSEAFKQAFKPALVKRFRTDPMGDPYWRKLLGIVAVVGGAETVARAYDSSIYEYALMHVPFLNWHRTGDLEVQPPLAWDSVNQISKLGLKNVLTNPKFFTAALLNHMGLYTLKRLEVMLGVPELIPDIYKGKAGTIPDNVRFWAGLPSVEAMHRSQERTLHFLHKKRMRMVDRMEKRGEHISVALQAFKNFVSHLADMISQ